MADETPNEGQQVNVDTGGGAVTVEQPSEQPAPDQGGGDEGGQGDGEE